MSRQVWSETIFWSEADGSAVVNTTTETVLIPANTALIPANYLADGRLLRIWAFGKYSNTSTPTMLFKLRAGGVGGTVLAQSAAVTTPTTVTNATWTLEIYIQVRSNGSSGTVMANGNLQVFAAVAPTVASATGAAASTPMTAGGVTAPATASFDMTANQDITLTLTWGTANAANTALCNNFVVEAMN